MAADALAGDIGWLFAFWRRIADNRAPREMMMGHILGLTKEQAIVTLRRPGCSFPKGPPGLKKQKKHNVVSLILAAVALPMSWAGASVTLQFNSNPNNVVGGSPQTIQAAPGATIVISLQLVSTTETTTAVIYWLSQFSGPGSGVFSITGRDLTGSHFNRPDRSDAQVTTAVDNFSNTEVSGFGNPDGIPDNLLAPQNGPDLSARWGPFISNPPGNHQVATYTLQLRFDALPGLYQIRTVTYGSFGGWADENFDQYEFDANAAFNVQVVPEPMTWSLLALALLVVFGLKMFRPYTP